MPDLHWHIGEDADQETMTQTTSPRRSRRGWIALLIVVVAGVGLGVAYRSIPEPTPHPMSTPPSTPLPPVMPIPLSEAIDREARALADGDVDTILAMHMPEDQAWTERKRSTIEPWGYPSLNGPPYTIIAFNLPTPTRAWVDIRQFRSGRFFRETRFYRWNKDRWLRSEADPSFWSDQTETLNTPHFHVIYFIEDRNFVRPVVDQLEKARDSVCADLGCSVTPLTYTLNLNTSVTNGWPISDDGREIRFASPRIIGVYEDGSPLGDEGLNLIWALAYTTVQQVAYGQYPAVKDERANLPLLWAIGDWAATRAAKRPDINWEQETEDELQKRPLPLETLWSNVTENNDQPVFHRAYATIQFIDQEYGAQSMPKLLKAFRTAQSFAEVIGKGLGVPFAEFDQKWLAWFQQPADTTR